MIQEGGGGTGSAVPCASRLALPFSLPFSLPGASTMDTTAEEQQGRAPCHWKL